MSDEDNFDLRKDAFMTLQEIYRSGDKYVIEMIKKHCEEACVDTT